MGACTIEFFLGRLGLDPGSASLHQCPTSIAEGGQRQQINLGGTVSLEPIQPMPARQQPSQMAKSRGNPGDTVLMRTGWPLLQIVVRLPCPIQERPPTPFYPPSVKRGGRSRREEGPTEKNRKRQKGERAHVLSRKQGEPFSDPLRIPSSGRKGGTQFLGATFSC